MSTLQQFQAGDWALPRQLLIRQVTSCWRTQALHVAVQLDLPDQLAHGHRTVSDLAKACECAPDGMLRLLRALCVLQVCREVEDGKYQLTAAGEALCRSPGDGHASLRALTLWWGGNMWPMWGDLAYSVRTGKSARQRQTGAANYDFLDRRPDVAVLFHAAMQALTELVTEDVVKLDSWGETKTLVDVGGGNGTLAAAIASKHRQLHATVLDRSDAEPTRESEFGKLIQQGRARFVAGDFFSEVPANADCYLLKSILHNWDDAACQHILATCASAAAPGAKLLLIDRIRPERLSHSHHDEALMRTDLNMLAGLGGRERSLSEFCELLSGCGFEISAVSTTRNEFSMIQAVRV